MASIRYLALGLRTRPATAVEVEAGYMSRLAQFLGDSKADRAARRLLREARAACLREIAA